MLNVKVDLIQNITLSESSNISLVVLDNQVKAWSGFKFSIPNTLTLILEYYPVKQSPLVADIVTGFSK